MRVRAGEGRGVFIAKRRVHPPAGVCKSGVAPATVTKDVGRVLLPVGAFMIPSSRRFQEMVDALEEGDLKRLVVLAQHPRTSLETSEEGLTILGLAVRRGVPEAVDALLQAGVDPDGGAEIEALSPLLVAVAMGEAAILERLLEAGADANVRDPGGATALMAAVAEQDQVAVEILLQAGADPALGDREGRTTLEIADDNGHTRIAHLLRESGAQEIPSSGDEDLETPSEDGETPLVAAIVAGREDLVRTLLAAGADPSNGRYGHSPLEAALMYRAPVAVIEALLRAGANPDEEMEGGWTPLMGAANQGSLQLAELLLDSGADPARRSDDGDTALSLGRRRGHVRVCELLERVVEKKRK